MNTKLLFHSSPLYDDLLHYWYKLMLQIRRENFSVVFQMPLDKSYQSYLPKETFYEILQLGFDLIADASLTESFHFVWEIFQAELIRDGYTQERYGELILLKELLFCLRDNDLQHFMDYVSAFSSKKTNQQITTHLIKIAKEIHYEPYEDLHKLLEQHKEKGRL